MLTYRPQAVIFDLDGLIIDTEVVARSAWQQSAAELGYQMNDDLYSNFIGRRTDDCTAKLLEAYGGAFPLSDFLILSDRLCREYLDRQGVPFKPGLHELLDLLDSRDMTKAVATGSPREDALLNLGALATDSSPQPASHQKSSYRHPHRQHFPTAFRIHYGISVIGYR